MHLLACLPNRQEVLLPLSAFSITLNYVIFSFKALAGLRNVAVINEVRYEQYVTGFA